MLDFLLIVLFCWLFYQAIRLTFRVAWGAAKVIAVILFILALPSLLGCALLAVACYAQGGKAHPYLGFGRSASRRSEDDGQGRDS